MSRPQPPHGLRLILLPDRLVLHDLTFALTNADPSNRNALIDAANSVHSRNSSTPTSTPDLLNLDLPTPPSSTTPHPSRPSQHRYLVLPFAPTHAPRSPPPPFETASPTEAGLTSGTTSLRVDAAPAFLGLLPLHTAIFAIFATQIRPAASLPSGPVLSVSKVSLIRLSSSLPSKDDKETAAAVAKLLDSGSILYSLFTDISNPAHGVPHGVKRPFHWNYPLVARLPSAVRSWSPVCIYGFIATHRMRIHNPTASTTGMSYSASPAQWTSSDFLLSLISRRSRRRAGTRFITRGVDAMGDVANFVETEQLVWRPDSPAIASFLVTRGSIPVFWRQDNGIARPAPQLDGPLVPSRRAFSRHFDAMRAAYSRVIAVSLVDFHGSEGILARTYAAHFDLLSTALPLEPEFDQSTVPLLVPFDFHAMCGGKDYERGLARLLERLRAHIDCLGFFTRAGDGSTRQQKGVFRVNCVDCLDRTNVVQSLIARVVLGAQLRSLFFPESTDDHPHLVPVIDQESEDRFKHVWGDNADAVSKQYSGTGALKTDFTRTGKRSTTGVIGDGVKSVMRMYYKNFVDESRQEVIDMLCGNAVIRQQADSGTTEQSTSTTPSLIDDGRPGFPTNTSSAGTRGKSAKMKPSSLWYSFEAMRINAGGDRQAVFVELHDDAMYVTTTDGLCFEYPRRSLLTWSKVDDSKLLDRKVPSRLRLTFKPSYATPCTASPLDLQFRGGTTNRENFLRALVSWAKPEVTALMKQTAIRVRFLASTSGGEHRLEDWGLDFEGSGANGLELVALIVPEGSGGSRASGLAAVPFDVDTSSYVLVAACSVGDKGPAVAVLASAQLAPAIMTVNETFVEKMTERGPGGASAISLDACGTTFCFVSASLSGEFDVIGALSSLKMGRQTSDITNQFHHFYMGGMFGDAAWSGVKAIPSGRAGRKWNIRDDDSVCYTLDNGLSAVRNSFPTLRYDDELKSESLWKTSNGGNGPHFVALAEGNVDGRRGPRLPKAPSQCVVKVSDVRGEDIQLPRGVEPSSQLNSMVVLQSEHASVDGPVARQMTRPISYPECREPLHLTIIPSDVEEVFDTFLLGQIAIPTPLGEPVAAGHFVLPLSIAQGDKIIQMEVPVRLGGKRTGRLSCSIQVEVNSRMDDNDASVETTTSSGIAHRSEIPVVPLPTASMPGHELNNGLDASQRANSGMTGQLGKYASSIRNTSMDDMNGRLDAARRKGAKQMKSVVNRLSSLLNQPPALATMSSLPSSMSTASSLPTVSNQSAGHPGISGRTRRPDTTRMPGSTSGRGDEGIQSARGSRHDDFDDFGQFQTAPSDKGGRGGRGDALLDGLRQGAGNSGQRNVVPAHASGGGDLLLSGLMGQQQQQGRGVSRRRGEEEEDGWGAFESALPGSGAENKDGGSSVGGSGNGRGDVGGGGGVESLIDL